VDPTFFELPLKKDMPYEDLFKKNECICDQNEIWKKCYPTEQDKIAFKAEKKSKKLAWTTFNVGD